MALADDILKVRILVGDTPNNPYYPLLTDDEYTKILETTNNDVMQAAILAAMSISFMIAGWNTREQIGDIAISNDYAKNYLAVLNKFISNPSIAIIPQGLFPWSATPACDESNLMNISVCDEVARKCGC